MKTMREVVQETIRIPMSGYGFHPAVPVAICRRSIKAQRASPLVRLKNKAGKFDLDKIGAPEMIPNGTMFDVTVGATRVEWARECGRLTIPGKIWLSGELTASQHADRFLNELESIKPGTGTAHRLAVTANRQAAQLVEAALRSLPDTRAVGVFYAILGTRPSGADSTIPPARLTLLRNTIALLRKTKPQGGKALPGVIIAAVALLVLHDKVPSRRWRGAAGDSWALAVAQGRTRRAGRGGMGSLVEHVAAVLEGKRRG